MIVVIGGSGRLGKLVVDRLAGKGGAIRIMARDPTTVPARWPNVEVVRGDARRAANLDRAVAGASTVVSAMSAFGMQRVTPREVDRDGNANLIAACERQGVDHVVLVSVRTASPTHPTALHRMKYEAEQRLMRSSLSWTILRPSPFIETFQQVLGAPLLEKGKTVVFGRARNPINFVSAHDVAWCVERASTDAALRGTAIDVGGPENLTLLEFVASFAAVTGARGPVTHIPLPVMRMISVVARPFNATFARLVQASVVMDTTDMAFDASRLRVQFPDLALTTAAEAARGDYALDRAAEPR